MSITFFCPDAPRLPARERCGGCEWLSQDSGKPMFGCGERLCEAGWWHSSESTLPEVNLANQTAMAVLRLLVETHEKGQWPAAMLDAVVRRGVRTINRPGIGPKTTVEVRVGVPARRSRVRPRGRATCRVKVPVEVGHSLVAEGNCVVARRGGE